MPGLPWVWNATQEEAARRYPADEALDGPVVAMTRAIDVDAPVDLVWRWLCQVALAPYSYDLLDNLGRRSPAHLVPGTEDLEIGQTMASVFTLTVVEPGRAWTAVTGPRAARVLGRCALTYAAEPAGPASRIVCRLTVPDRPGLVRRVTATALAWGDLVMMRHQLHRLRGYAERDARAGG